MKLASKSLLKGVTAKAERPKKRSTFLFPSISPVGAAKRCACGACKFCMENARWEQIFDKKFADPEYYSDRASRVWASRVGSPLSNL